MDDVSAGIPLQDLGSQCVFKKETGGAFFKNGQNIWTESMHNSDKTFQFDVHPQCEEMRSSPKSPVRVVLTRKYNMQVVVVKIEASGYYWCYDVNNDLEDEVWNVAGQGCWQSTASENMPLTQGHVQIAGIPAMEGSNTVRKFDPRAPSTVQMGYHPATGEAYDNSDFSHRSNHFQAHANRYDDTSCIVNPRKSWCYFMQKNPIFCVITCLVAAAFTLLFEGFIVGTGYTLHDKASRTTVIIIIPLVILFMACCISCCTDDCVRHIHAYYRIMVLAAMSAAILCAVIALQMFLFSAWTVRMGTLQRDIVPTSLTDYNSGYGNVNDPATVLYFHETAVIDETNLLFRTTIYGESLCLAPIRPAADKGSPLLATSTLYYGYSYDTKCCKVATMASCFPVFPPPPTGAPSANKPNVVAGVVDSKKRDNVVSSGVDDRLTALSSYFGTSNANLGPMAFFQVKSDPLKTAEEERKKGAIWVAVGVVMWIPFFLLYVAVYECTKANDWDCLDCYYCNCHYHAGGDNRNRNMDADEVGNGGEGAGSDGCDCSCFDSCCNSLQDCGCCKCDCDLCQVDCSDSMCWCKDVKCDLDSCDFNGIDCCSSCVKCCDCGKCCNGCDCGDCDCNCGGCDC